MRMGLGMSQQVERQADSEDDNEEWAETCTTLVDLWGKLLLNERAGRGFK